MIKVVKFKSDLVSKMETFMLGFESIHTTGKFPDLLANLSTRDCKSSPKLCLGHSGK